MTKSKKNERNALDRLADALVNDVLQTSDEEILAEFQENCGDPGRHAEEMRTLFEVSLLTANKTRLAAARAGVISVKQNSNLAPTTINITEARKRLRAALENRSGTQKLTLAARNENELSDTDILSMVDDLRELGVLPMDDKESQ